MRRLTAQRRGGSPVEIAMAEDRVKLIHARIRHCETTLQRLHATRRRLAALPATRTRKRLMEINRAAIATLEGTRDVLRRFKPIAASEFVPGPAAGDR